jgi:Alb1
VQTRQQRLRQERGLSRAEDVLGKLDRKVEGSLRRRKIGRERRRGWEEVNGVKAGRDLVVGGVDEGGAGGAGAVVGGEEGAMMEVKDEVDASAVVGRVETGDEEKEGLRVLPEIEHPLLAEVDEVENEEDKIT